MSWDVIQLSAGDRRRSLSRVLRLLRTSSGSRHAKNVRAFLHDSDSPDGSASAMRSPLQRAPLPASEVDNTDMTP
jgi:hypothetical protein